MHQCGESNTHTLYFANVLSDNRAKHLCTRSKSLDSIIFLQKKTFWKSTKVEDKCQSLFVSEKTIADLLSYLSARKNICPPCRNVCRGDTMSGVLCALTAFIIGARFLWPKSKVHWRKKETWVQIQSFVILVDIRNVFIFLSRFPEREVVFVQDLRQHRPNSIGRWATRSRHANEALWICANMTASVKSRRNCTDYWPATFSYRWP